MLQIQNMYIKIFRGKIKINLKREEWYIRKVENKKGEKKGNFEAKSRVFGSERASEAESEVFTYEGGVGLRWRRVCRWWHTRGRRREGGQRTEVGRSLGVANWRHRGASLLLLG